MSGLISVIADGVAYGMLLLLFSVGLSVTLGLMRFINLAHGAFAMCGGYVAALALGRGGVPFLLTLPLAFGVTALVGVAAERTVIRHVYAMPALQQVLFSIGLAFAASAVATILFGPQQQAMLLPDWLTQPVDLFGLHIGGYRVFLVLAGLLATAALFLLFNRTLFGARIRAAVDSRRTAEGIGINVDRLFAVAFGLGAGLAGLGGALSVGFLGLDPTFPFKYLTIVLMVVAIGGPGSIGGSVLAALGLGVIDAVFKYLWPEVGSFVIYGLLVIMMIACPTGLAGRRA
ncbi:branched-chain amino acid ABC transporter permease [Bradyrhizobium sp. U87765 SZCCT0131]|uniref:branched-chain amino acid ABC transporter permease n=1 Tax=unclassified Bradyrhizobium TaxID=2631580 RepID=UPI001BAB0B96|nr:MULTISPECIES: branched-chain amino acid ABC transporter permease [unclassified Bradyrhizobium]MBR1219053.1 branched-chain amino acid ABC transporter permease [Bradyrhizobium sp. U87765 SZCCT0131]MBR1261704.1 branched-chain amino acid ABC transporter permease [Bradyrhizobium sp. U87765 SZCCT0134]MBR1306443.1 branched-chain amino acid ABC transporter permease [Bradyrhizobium sp. U87765 SZCCT0110]MBR1317486.1 branched-chain amino acid ABC transporter permease [Bradyrhizobium sp. U87765 SZCCT010